MRKRTVKLWRLVSAMLPCGLDAEHAQLRVDLGDLRLEFSRHERPEVIAKTFTLRWVKCSGPYCRPFSRALKHTSSAVRIVLARSIKDSRCLPSSVVRFASSNVLICLFSMID